MVEGLNIACKHQSSKPIQLLNHIFSVRRMLFYFLLKEIIFVIQNKVVFLQNLRMWLKSNASSHL